VKPDLSSSARRSGGASLPVSGVVGSRETLGLSVPATTDLHLEATARLRVGMARSTSSSGAASGRSAEMGAYFMERPGQKSQRVKEVRGGAPDRRRIKGGARTARPYCAEVMGLGSCAKETHHQVIRFAPPLVMSPGGRLGARPQSRRCSPSRSTAGLHVSRA